MVRPVSQSNRARDRTPVIHSCQNQSRAPGPLSLPSIAVDPLAIKATAQYKRRWILVHINTTQATPRCHKCNTHIKAINAMMLGVCHGHTAKLLAIKAITQHQRCWILVNTVAIKATPCCPKGDSHVKAADAMMLSLSQPACQTSCHQGNHTTPAMLDTSACQN